MNRKILIIDIETTGFLREGGAIVEIGMVSLDLDSGTIATVFDSVCRESILSEKHRKPPMGWIFRNSSLTVEEVRVAQLLPELLGQVQGIIDAHPLGATAYNRNFDFDFLESRGVVFPRLCASCSLIAMGAISGLQWSRRGSISSLQNHMWSCIEAQTTPGMRHGLLSGCMSLVNSRCRGQIKIEIGWTV